MSNPSPGAGPADARSPAPEAATTAALFRSLADQGTRLAHGARVEEGVPR